MYRASEFAALAGVTVRTLHHYDKVGLLKPKRRTEAGYRLYEDRDLERLEQVVALRFLGMPLQQIHALMAEGAPGLREALRRQRVLLLEKRRMLDKAIQAIGEAERAANFASLKNIIGVIEMETNNDWMSKYQTEASKAKTEARRPLWSPALQERVSAQWNQLIADVDAAQGENPGSQKAQALTARWDELVEGFTGGDPDITASVANMWADRANWPADMDTRAPVITSEVWTFIARARAARKL